MSEKFRELVGINIGRASVAWSETPKGVFDSEVCSALVDEIVVAYEKDIKRTNEVLDMQKLISSEYKDAIVGFLNLIHKDAELPPHDARILLKTWQDLHNKSAKCLSETAPETYLKLKNKIQELEAFKKEALRELGIAEQYMSKVETEGCCNGRDCGCLGMPTNPEYYIASNLREFLSKHGDKA